MISFEKLDVYQAAKELRRILREKILPRCDAELRDQLYRANTSVMLNIAEGAGRWQPRDKKRFYEIARGSAFECASVLGIVRTDDDSADVEGSYLLAERIIQMLTKLCQRGS